MNALVLYVGVQAINQHDNRHTPSQSTIAHSAHMDIFQHLAIDLDNEGNIPESVFCAKFDPTLKHNKRRKQFGSL